MVDPARIIRVCREMADFDVLCFQEVARNFAGLEGSRGEDQFALLAGAAPGFALIEGIAIDQLAPDGARRQFGNAILSRLPVLQVFRHLLPWPADASAPSMQRVGLEAVLQARFGAVRVTTTHLEYYSETQRAAQVERLRGLQAEACGHSGAMGRSEKEGGPFAPLPRPASSIVTGDFNFRPEDSLHVRLQAPIGAGIPSYRDSWEIRNPGKPQPPTLGVHDKEQWPEDPFCCDFIFVSEDLAARVQDVSVEHSTDASDHQPVLLSLRD